MSSDSESSSSCTSPTPSSSCTSPTPSSGSGKSSSSSSSTKRCNKPQMERKRRERINCSLNVLKQLVLDALKKDTSQYSKLEKADILEMTVKHLRDLQRGQLVKAASSDASVVSKYRAGFTECASEVTRYLGSVDGVRPEVRDRLVNHLNGCVHRVHTTPAQAHAEQQQQRSAQAYYATTTSSLPVYQTTMVAPPSASSSAAQISISPTRPIQIQIPVATSPASLPGAGVQALQMAIPTSAAVTGTGSGAASSSTAASAAAASNVSVAYLPRVIQHQQQQQQQQQQQHTTGSSSPLSHGSATYMAAFQVVASGAQPGGPAFMLPPGQLATPIYAVNASPAQQVQLQQLLVQQMAAATPTSGVSASGPGIHSPASPAASAVTLLAPAPVPAAAAVAVAPSGVNLKRRAGAEDTHRLPQRHHADSSGTNRAAKKMMMMASYSPKVVTSYNANVAINETLRDEKVWRPW